MRVTRTLREQGVPLSETLARSPAPATHESVVDCVQRYAEALHDYRSAIVRELVEDEGWTLSEIAARTGSARQVVSRLYHAPETPRGGAPPCPKLQLRPSRGD